MLRTTSGLSRPLPNRVSRVAASLGAVLAAACIWSAVPRPAAAPAAEPELTAGGKFAARAVAEPVAYDGLDAMPLPRLAPVPAFLAAADDAAPAPRRTSSEAAASAVPERAARPPRTAHVHAAPARLPPARGAPLAAEAAGPAPEKAGEEDVLARMTPPWLSRASSATAAVARDAWAATASAGDALVARVVPQVP